MPSADELESVAENFLESQYLRSSRSLTSLFKHLWENREHYTHSQDLWLRVLEPLSASTQKRGQHDDDANVRERCRELRKALRDYYKSVKPCWHIDLPPAVRSTGYKLKVEKIADPMSQVLAFWRGHLFPPRDIFIVHVEPVFFHDWDKQIIFRYYDSNEENETQALAELKARHPEGYKDNVTPAYLYIASGEVEARDLITEWFASHAFIRVQHAVTRHIKTARGVWDGSLILFGSAFGNSVMAEILRAYPDLPIEFRHSNTPATQHPWQVAITHPTDDEIQRFAPYNPAHAENKCVLEFVPEKGVILAILTRVPNPYRRDTSLTLFTSDFARATQQLARMLTDEEELRDFEVPTVPFFQILFAIEIRSLSDDNRRTIPKILAWRPYSA